MLADTKKHREPSGSRCRTFLRDLLYEEVQDEGEQDEHRGDPLGEARKAGVQSFGLVLGKECVAAAAADGAGESGTLAALEQYDGHESHASDELDDGYDSL